MGRRPSPNGSKRFNPNLSQYTIFVNKSALTICQAYSKEVHQKISDLLASEIETFNQAIIEKARQITELRKQSFQKMIEDAQSEQLKPIEVVVQ